MPKSIKRILKKNKKISVNGSLWIECDGHRFFGPGPLELLERIGKTGSINQAAREMHMSYKKSWEIITTLNEQSLQPLVITQTGGPKGGGSVISDEAKELIDRYRLLRERFKKFLEKETGKMD
ncbi:MAG: putative transcriptional regulator, ModE family [Chitinophagaceae bacterium]|nr:putative transcriptional regulator, ModE family [Chitinophagaceae bacterium]